MQPGCLLVLFAARRLESGVNLRAFMRKILLLSPCIASLFLLSSCSPRDFLTRRLAADLIAGSETFRALQQIQLRTGILSNTDYLASNILALQHHGWISAIKVACPSSLAPPPCWDLTLTPLGVDTFKNLISPADAAKQFFSIPAARRELVTVSGIAKEGSFADVEFTWNWVALNEVGAVFYPADITYRSTTSFLRYDDGWRVISDNSHHGLALDEALKNAVPMQ
jgi:hypothetical protein